MLKSGKVGKPPAEPAPPSRLTPLYIIAAALFMTAVAAIFVAKNEIAQRRAEFTASVRQIEENIRSRIDSYTSLLLGGAGFMSAMDNVSARDFADFAGRLNIGEEYPGVQGIGFSARIKPEEKAAVEEAMRQQVGNDFKIWPETPRAEYHSILYLEPLDRRNAAAIGFDMFTEEIRQAAMVRARDTGRPTATGRVKLVQEVVGSVQNGFLIYVPVYRGGTVPATEAERRDALRGFVYSPFRIGDLLAGIISHGAKSRVILRLYDEQRTEDNLLHVMSTAGPPEKPMLHSTLHESSELQIGGRRWLLDWESAPLFLGGSLSLGALLIGLTGILLTVFLHRSVRSERAARSASDANSAALHEEKEMLRVSEERFRLFMERAREYAILLVDNEGRISSWNPGAERIFGFDSAIVGQPLATLFTPEDRAANAPEHQLAAARAHGQFVDERWHLRKDGSRFWASGSLISLRHDSSQRHGYVKILRDMTVRKENEEAIRELNQQLEERVRVRTAAVEELNAQLEAFTYTVVHDLRAPLRAMHGFSTALLDDYGPKLDATAHEFLNRITAAAQRMDTLIQDLLNLSHVSRADIKFSAVSLDKAVDNVLKTLAPSIAEAAADIDVQRPLPEILAESKILEGVLHNLLSNAIKFRRPGVIPTIKIFAMREGDNVRVFVRDNGIGIQPEHHDRVFRVFERLHGQDSYPGTGMGLAIVKKSLERLRGKVGLESTPGKGSTFWFEAPAVENPPSR